MTSNVGRHGFPVLAYTKTDAASPVDAVLVLRSNKTRMQATLCLSVALQDSENAPTIVFQYDADNLVTGTLYLQPAVTGLPQSRLARITLSSAPQLQILSLRLQHGCPLWGSHSGSITPKDGDDVTSRQLANLAKTTELYILFASQRLHKALHPILQHVVAHPDQFSAFPVARYYEDIGLARLDASIFDTVPGSHEDIASDATIEDEEPPPYEARTLKRPRVASSSPTPKRAFLSDLEDVAPSPTDKTSTPATSPRLPYNPVASTPEIQNAVDVAVSKFMSNVLTVALLTIRQTESPRTSPAPSSSPSLLSKTLGECIARRHGKELGKFFDRILSEYSHQHIEEYESFSEELHEKLLELDVIKDEIVTELRCVSVDELDSLKQDCEALMEHIGDGFEHKLFMLSDVTLEKAKALKNQEAELAMEKKILAREQQLLAMDWAILDRKTQLFELEKKVYKGQDKLRAVREATERGGRAGSAPT